MNAAIRMKPRNHANRRALRPLLALVILAGAAFQGTGALNAQTGAAPRMPGRDTAPLLPDRPRLQIINGSTRPIEIFWLKSATERVPNGTVAAGKDSIITTTIGHRFAIVSREDNTEATVTSEVPVQAFRFDPQGRDGIPLFYTQIVRANGLPIVGSARINPYALKEAAYLVDQMLANRPDVREAMIASGSRVCILAYNEFTTDQPEFAHLGDSETRGLPDISGKDYIDARARGLGGSRTDPFCSCAELLEYDPGLAAICREVFGDTVLVYTRPATRLTGHLAGYDPATAPAFAWPERLRNAQDFIKQQARARSEAASGGGKRETREIAGWSVRIDKSLLLSERAATERALELIEAQLDEIIRVVPAAPVAELKKVPLYLSPVYPGARPKAEYHPDAGWLREHGRDERQDADGNKRMDRAYAMTNPQEYFAETSEAFFGRNDFFPYTRDELHRHDPGMHDLLEILWKSGL